MNDKDETANDFLIESILSINDKDETVNDFLKQLVMKREPVCQLKGLNIILPKLKNKNKNNNNNNNSVVIVSSLAVARSGSTTLSKKLQSTKQKMKDDENGIVIIYPQHNHDCILRDFEDKIKYSIQKKSRKKTTKTTNVYFRVLVPLRHPLARISSGVSRRMEKEQTKKEANRLFQKNFVAAAQKKKKKNQKYDDNDFYYLVTEKFVGALRNKSDPLHEIAQKVVHGPKTQQYLKPVTEMFLSDSTYSMGITETEIQINNKNNNEASFLLKTEVEFVCTDTLDEDYDEVFQKWFPKHKSLFTKQQGKAKKTKSKKSSGNFTNVLSRFSEKSVEWVERIYANDIQLYKEHCPEGYREYSKSKSDLFHSSKQQQQQQSS